MESVSISVAFLAGIVSFASPCFLPIAPVFVTYLTGGTSKQDQTTVPAVRALATAGVPSSDGFIRYDRPTATPATTARRASGPWWGVLNAVAFVASFAAVFMAFWLLVSLVGLSVGEYRGVLRIGGGVALILLGLFTLGFFSQGIFRSGTGTGRSPLERMNTAGEPTLRRSALMGLAFAAAWSPCIGPVLAVILGLAMAHGTLGTGMALLAAYSIGLGLPLVLLAAGVGGLKERLSWLTRHQRVLTTVSGVLLIAVGFLLVMDLLAPLSNISLNGM